MSSKRGTLKFSYLGLDTASLKSSIFERLHYSIGKKPNAASSHDWYHTAAYVVRDRMVERWLQTLQSYAAASPKRVYYLSMEFLIGRMLGDNLTKLDATDEFRGALEAAGADLETVVETEPDAALGNGGLGRLAACFLDSMATLRLPGFGYGIRYEYGMFNQRIENGQQVEHPDNWLRYGNPWEFPRPEVLFPVRFFGKVITEDAGNGATRQRWVDTDEVMAMAYDMLIPGYANNTVNHLRLWTAKASRDFNLAYFNEGNYIKAVEEQNDSENLSRVLYPDDTTSMGRELRLQQEYFFVSAALQDILKDFFSAGHMADALSDKVAIQLNDTHPAVAVPELMRLLMDEHELPWDEAWSITRKTFSYTNHTLMPEALESWPLDLFGRMLPRHLQIVYEINQRFLDDVRRRFPGQEDRIRRLSLIDEQGERRIRMSHLAMVGSHTVNGVSAIHTDLMRQTIFADFHAVQPQQIINITNGITPRRWLHHCNRKLSNLISEHIGHGWITHLDRLGQLRSLAADSNFRTAFSAVKRANKDRLAQLIHARLGIAVPVDSLFDVQIKRIHEYKRQALNLLHAIALYNRICDSPKSFRQPRTIILSGKAAPGYAMAKLIIRAINDVGAVINADPRTRDRLRLIFVPNYDVSTAGDIIPAAELSQQISLAGTEASGTGNMKLALNGALTIGTLDGANVEIREAVGEENIFIFGLTADQVGREQRGGYRARDYVERNPVLDEILRQLAAGRYSAGEPDRYRPLVNRLLDNDPYLVLADFQSYLKAQESVARLYAQPEEWNRRAILNVAAMGRFSSDRTINEYAERVWGVKPVAHE